MAIRSKRNGLLPQWLFRCSAKQAAGMERAAKWHEAYANVFRDALAKRIENNIRPDPEQAAQEQFHRSCARQFRAIVSGEYDEPAPTQPQTP